MRVALLGIGLFAASFLPQSAHAFPARFGLSPDNSQEMLLSVLEGAQSELTINIYEFKSYAILDALVARIKDGVDVKLLLEGQPASTMSPIAYSIIQQLKNAMIKQGNPNNLFYVLTDRNGGKRRFAYNHAKYIVADKKRVMVSSENFSPSTYVAPGYTGNRGWHTVLESTAVASKMLALFKSDANPAESDIVDMLEDSTSFRVKKRAETKIKPRPVATIAEGKGDVSFATLVTSPDSIDGIAGLIDSADSHVELEYASLPPEWMKPSKHQSPIVDALIRAARRDVHVRVLLNDDRVFESKERPDEDEPVEAKVYANEVTVKLLQTIAKAEKLSLQARVVDTEKAGLTYIHNKGILVDGKRAFVSSINGTQNSVTNNREVALVLESPDAAWYFQKAFDFDWNVSAKKKFDLRVAGLNIQDWLVEFSQ